MKIWNEVYNVSVSVTDHKSANVNDYYYDDVYPYVVILQYYQCVIWYEGTSSSAIIISRTMLKTHGITRNKLHILV